MYCRTLFTPFQGGAIPGLLRLAHTRVTGTNNTVNYKPKSCKLSETRGSEQRQLLDTIMVLDCVDFTTGVSYWGRILTDALKKLLTKWAMSIFR